MKLSWISKQLVLKKENIIRCLKAAFGDPNRAYDYLTMGIPLNIEKQLEQQEKMNTGNKEDKKNDNPLEEFFFLNQNKDKEEGEREEDLNLESILNQIPQFEQIRQTIQQRPELLGPIVEKIAETSPELYQLIQQFPEEFMRIMNDKKPLSNSNNTESNNNQNTDDMRRNAPPGTVFISKEEKRSNW